MSSSTFPALPFCPTAVDSVGKIDYEIAKRSIGPNGVSGITSFTGYSGSNFPIGFTLKEVVRLYWLTNYIDFYPWIYSEWQTNEDPPKTVISSAYVVSNSRVILETSEGDKDAGTNIATAIKKRQCGSVNRTKVSITYTQIGTTTPGTSTADLKNSFFGITLIPPIGGKEEFYTKCLYDRSTQLYYPAFSFNGLGNYEESWSTFVVHSYSDFGNGTRSIYSGPSVVVDLYMDDTTKQFTMYRVDGTYTSANNSYKTPLHPAQYSFPAATVAFLT